MALVKTQTKAIANKTIPTFLLILSPRIIMITNVNLKKCRKKIIALFNYYFFTSNSTLKRRFSLRLNI